MKKIRLLLAFMMIQNIIVPTVASATTVEGSNTEPPVETQPVQTTSLGADITFPEIDVNTLSVDKVAAALGDTVKVSIKITDDRSMSSVRIYYRAPVTGKSKLVTMSYNVDTGLYEGQFTVTESDEDGLWQVSQIVAKDSSSNEITLYNNQVWSFSNKADLSAGNFSVFGTDADKLFPEIDVNTLSVDKVAAALGDTVKVSIKITDDRSMSSVRLYYRAPVTGKSKLVTMSYNVDTGLYEGQFTVTESDEDGLWQVSQIVAKDSSSNEITLYNNQVWSFSNKADLSAGNFSVFGTDADKLFPEIDVNTLSVDKVAAALGDTVKVSIKITDDRSMSSVRLYYRAPVTGKSKLVTMSYNVDNGLYEGQFTVTESDEDGLWQVSQIVAKDSSSNEITLYNNQVWSFSNKADLSAGDFEIYPAPSIEVSDREFQLGSNVDLKSLASAFDKIDGDISGSIEVQTSNVDFSKRGSYEVTYYVENSIGKSSTATANIKIVDPKVVRVMFPEETVTLNANESYKLNYDIELQDNPDYTATWTSSAPDVVSVDEVGNITAIKKGTATITVKAGEVSDTVTVNVLLPLDKIEIEQSDLTLLISEEKQLDVNYFPGETTDEKSVVWSSSDKNVVEVSSEGKLTAKTDGTAEITAVVGDKQDTVVVTVKQPSIIYSTSIESEGWQLDKRNGELSGTENQAKRLEAIKISLGDIALDGSVEYQTHIQGYGWMDWSKDGSISGTVNESRRMEAIRIKLTGAVSEKYDIYYRVHAQSYGWLDWAKNGADAGTEGLGKRLEAIEIQLVPKNEAAPGKAEVAYIKSNPIVSYRTHVQRQGWQDYVQNGEMSGTEGQSLRLEAIKINVKDLAYTGGIEYRTHVQREGWQDWKSDDQLSGTEGKGLRLEAIGIRLTGDLANHYDVYYRVHAQSFGWLEWAKNGESAGTQGLARRLEGIEIVIVKKGEAAPGSTSRRFVLSNPSVNYTTHVQKEGWQNTVKDGAMSGTSGKGLRLEAILINMFKQSLTGDIQYRTHVQKEGWQDWKQNWQVSGTSGKGLRLEAIEIKLTDEMAKFYDVYYRVHAQTYGWLGWAKNGESAGTEGLAKRLEGIEIKLVRKGSPAPGSQVNKFIKK